MGLFTGSVSLVRYQVLSMDQEKTSKLSIEQLNKEYKKFLAKPLTEDCRPYNDIDIGWTPCPIVPEEDSDPDSEGLWDLSHQRLDQGYVLRVRIDKRRVPSEVLKAQFKKVLGKNTKSKKLSKDERLVIREEVRAKLVNQALPLVQYVDAYWNVEKNILFLFSHAASVQKVFETLFTKTFAPLLVGRTIKKSLIVKIEAPLNILPHKAWQDPDSKLAKSFISRLSSTLPSTWTSSI